MPYPGTQKGSQFNILHCLLVAFLKLSVQSNVLIDCQCFPPSVACNELEFGISEAGMPGQPPP